MALLPLLDALQDDEDVTALSLPQLLSFFSLISHLQERLSWNQTPDSTIPPLLLPPDVTQFLCLALDVDDDVLLKTWGILRTFLPTPRAKHTSVYQSPLQNASLLPLFLQYGLKFGIGFFDLFPPTRVCLDPKCGITNIGTNTRELTNVLRYEVVLFTCNMGALPVWAYSATCNACKTRYYPNYYVHEDHSIRTYYPGVPQVIQVSMHCYIETSLIRQFTNQMVCAWVSGTNLSRIYNLNFSEPEARISPSRWPFEFMLTCDHVWDSFFIYSLILDRTEHGTVLDLPHIVPDQAFRLRAALEARTAAMAGPGQEFWNHACELCCKYRTAESGAVEALRATVTDGVSIGHPCCGVHDCKEPLASQRNRFCTKHENLKSVCAVTVCSRPCDPGYKTCTLQEHRQLEIAGNDQRTAMFQLRQRLERLNSTQVEDALSSGLGATLEDEDDSISPEGQCDDKSPDGNVKLRIQMNRRRTHNEQLCVTTCGVILGRATFFGSEAVHGVVLFHQKLFPTPQSVPGVNFFDNNCHLKKHLIATSNHYFDRCALPVDVFHMKTKHRESDNFCNEACNPARFPDLIKDGRWTFNSSAAEMTNAWFGGFKSVVREMRAERYNFFLDEMIKQRNRIIVADLRKRHACPIQIPRAHLLCTESSDVY